VRCPAVLAIGLLAACSRDEAGPAAAPAPAQVAPVQAEPEPEPEPEPPAAPSRDPQRPLELRVTGDEFRWRIRYPGPDDRLDTPDDVEAWRHLYLPARTEIVIDLCSADYVYTFYVPAFDIMEAAVPKVPFEIDFETGPPGRFDLLGSQMCSYTHTELLGDTVVLPPAEFERWMSALGD